MAEIERDWLLPYSQHGLTFGRSSDGKNFVTDCPFTGKQKKFSVDRTTGMWNAWSAGRSGNIYTFIREMWKIWEADTEASDLAPLAKEKNLMVSSLLGEVAYDRSQERYIMPMRNAEGKIINLSSYILGKKKMFRTKFCPVSLIGMENIKENSKYPIFVCEGEWDRLALQWLLRVIKQRAVVVAVPGALIFKDSWVPLFRGLKTYLCYDHDVPGQKGLVKAVDYLDGTAGQLLGLQWPEILRSGYDVKDFIVEKCGKTLSKSKMENAYQVFMKLMVPVDSDDMESSDDLDMVDVPTREEIEDIFRKWFELDNLDPVHIVLGTVFANMIGGDPIWMMLVGPPGSLKTEILNTLSDSPRIETVSTLTPAALISAYRTTKKVQDPSLLARLDGRNLVVKDLTALLNNQTNVRDEVFGLLRDAYDGKVEKAFSFGTKSYKSRFGLLAGVTNIIDSYSGMASMLGERFLRKRMPVGTQEEEERKILRAMANVEKERAMRRELCDVVKRYLEKPLPQKLPEISRERQRKIMAMSQFVARMRGAVQRDKFSAEILSLPTQEIATRIGKQLYQLSQGFAVHLDLPEVDDYCLHLTRSVAVDTVPAIQEMIVKLIYKEVSNGRTAIGQTLISQKTRLSQSTVSRRMEDLVMLNITEKVKGEKRVSTFYDLTPFIKNCLKQAEIYPELG